MNSRIIADALIDQSKQKDPYCPCAGGVTAYTSAMQISGALRCFI
jgi:hypothetical protein